MEQTVTVSKKVPHNGYNLKIQDVYLVKENEVRHKLIAIAHLKKITNENLIEQERDITDSVIVQLPPEHKDLPVEIVIAENEDLIKKESEKYPDSIHLYHQAEFPVQSDAKEVEQAGVVEKIIHFVSFGYPKSMEKVGYWDPRNLIAPNLFLSRLPERGEEKQILQFVKSMAYPLGLVVSVVKHYEVNQSLPSVSMPWMDPIRPEEWEKMGVNHYRLPMQDFGSQVIVDKAANIVLEIQRRRENKQSVLVHCKAGRTRSAMLVACVLAVFDLGQNKMYKDKSPEQLIDLAIEKMLPNRKQVKMFNAIKATAVKIVLEVRQMLQAKAASKSGLHQLQSDEKSEGMKLDVSLLEKINHCFANQDIINEIIKLDAYKDLTSYKNKIIEESRIWSPKRAQHIQKLLTSISEAQDAKWYSELIKLTGPSKDLISAAPFFNVNDADKDKIKRESLIDKLKNDVESLLCLNLGCNKAEFQEVFLRPESTLAMSC